MLKLRLIFLGFFLLLVLSVKAQDFSFDNVLTDTPTKEPFIQNWSMGFDFALPRYRTNGATVNYQHPSFSLNDQIPVDFNRAIVLNIRLAMVMKYGFFLSSESGVGFNISPEMQTLQTGLSFGKYLSLIESSSYKLNLAVSYGGGIHTLDIPWESIPNANYRIRRRLFTAQELLVYPSMRGLYHQPALGISLSPYTFLNGDPDDAIERWTIELWVRHFFIANQRIGLKFAEFDFEGDLVSTRVRSDDPGLTINTQGAGFLMNYTQISLGLKYYFGR
jgi:hypothetical protein